MNLKKIVASVLVISVVIGAIPSSVVKAVEDEGEIIEKNLNNDDYQYEINEEGVRITKYLGNEEKIVIPDYIDGEKVTSIGEYAFQNCDNLKKVTIGKEVKTIES